MSLLFALGMAFLMFLLAWRSRLQYERLPSLPSTTDQSGEEVAVIIPARNEAHNIARVVRSLKGNRVLVVDDESTDGTRDAAARAGAAVIPAQTRPAGWLGKPNACWTGALHSDAPWLLFVDADTWYEPGFAASLLGYARRQKIDAVSVFPRRIYGSWAEWVLLPYAFGLYFCGVDARCVNEHRNAEALANGQCLLIRRELYEFVGGHRAVAGSVMEDAALAQLFKRHRVRSHVIRGEDLARVRMYRNFVELWRGFQKSSFGLLLANPKGGMRVIFASLLMTSWLPLFLWLLHDGYREAAAAFFLVPALAWWRWYGSPFRALAAPLAIYLFQFVALGGLFKKLFRIPTRWKDRPV